MVSVIGKNPNLSVKGIRPARTLLPKYRQVIGDCSYLFSQPFTTEWAVAGDAAARTITLPLVQNRAEGALSYNCIVDWGDCTPLSVVTSYNDANRIHTYAQDGTYQVKISGIMEGWSFNGGGDCLKITKVVHWGSTPIFAGFKYLKSGFYGCTNLVQAGSGPIPASGNGIETDGFEQTFRNCSISIFPAKLFSKHPNALTFYMACRENLVTVIPPGFFDNNVACTNFNRVFAYLPITTTPSGLFRLNVNCVNFSYAFYECTVHQQNADLFYDDGEQSTRFLNQDVNFTGCFYRSSFSGSQGTAPDLWNCNYGTGTPTTTSCWAGAGNSTTSLTNYASIPAGWK